MDLDTLSLSLALSRLIIFLPGLDPGVGCNHLLKCTLSWLSLLLPLSAGQSAPLVQPGFPPAPHACARANTGLEEETAQAPERRGSQLTPLI